MKVEELIAELNKVKDKQQEVFISIDEEGNDFKPIDVLVEIRKEHDYKTAGDEVIFGIIIYPIG